MLENTYTYTARSADNPEQIVTLTLHNHSLSVGVGAPLEHIERALQAESAENEEEPTYHIQPWLKPMAISLVERGMRPFSVDDVGADVERDWLRVRAWFRVGGLRLAPVTLVAGRVDNPDAAQAFVKELNTRKAATGLPGFLGLLDYWAAWFVAGFVMMVILERWRRKRGSEAT